MNVCRVALVTIGWCPAQVAGFSDDEAVREFEALRDRIGGDW